ncbi:MAG: DUF2330 domain-containing protein, partial [Polyangiaceae bacterium]
IRYSGSPSSFAWVLPISGTATVGLSADVVFATLDGLTQSQVIQPPLNCPPPPDDCSSRNAPNASFGAGGAEDSADAGVAVTKTEVVGPYETVQLHSTSGQALNDWLTSHGYAIPADVAPIITAYVDAHFDFLAMKLAPGKSVQSMRPVRITTAGAAPILPLRMVTAGTGAVVGITLWVVAEGRYEPQNFPFFHIADSDLVWNWATSSSNFTQLRADKEAALGGKGWEVESSTEQFATQFTNYVKNGGFFGGGFGGGGAPQAADDYAPITDANGVVTKTADEVRDEDMAALFAGIQTTQVRFTRVRSDLAHAALADDLVLQASPDQTVLTNVRTVSKESGQPNCPVYDGCSQVGMAPRDQAAAMTAMNGRVGSGGGCTTASRSIHGNELTLFALSGFFGLAILRSRRRDRR